MFKPTYYILAIFAIYCSFKVESNQNAQVYCHINDYKLVAVQSDETRDGIPFKKFKVDSKTTTLEYTVSHVSTLSPQYKWSLNDHPLAIPQGETGHLYYTQKDKKVTLHFKGLSSRYSGKYTLEIVNPDSGESLSKADCNLFTDVPLLDLSFETIRETEGSKASIVCTSSSSPKPQEVNWKFYDNGQWINVKDVAYNTSNGIRNSELVIEKLKQQHEGYYMCSTKGAMKEDQVIYALRVRNPNAVYWPLIGICIEVVILLITILVYEKQQYDKRKRESVENKAILDEAAQPLMQSAETKNVRV